MALERGTQLGHYDITHQIGKGGMGEVYRARDTKLGREVAIKVLPTEFSRDEERLARFEREARMLAALNHPNIAAIYGLEQSGDTRFLVLELVEGDTLADRLTRGAVPVEESLELALQIAEALEAAHDKGVVHRDLKPANIKITPEGRVKVLDFGLAKAFIGEQADVDLSNSPTLSMAATQAGVILGTAAYMSPEQASGEVSDHRSDVWSFGVVLFEMLSGRQLFTGRTSSHVMGAVLERQPDWNSLPPNLHPRVREALERCLEKDPRDRRQTVADVRFDLQKVMAEPGRGVVPQTRAAAGGRGSHWTWAAALLAAVLSGMGAWMLKPNPAAETHGVVRAPFVLPDGQRLSSLEVHAIDVARDGQMIAYTAGGQLWVKALDEDAPRLVQGADVPATMPVISPDGLSVAYVALGGTAFLLRRIQIAGGAPGTLWEGSDFPAPVWNRDDTIFFWQPEGIMQIPATGGIEPTLEVAAAEGEALDAPSLLPNGDILFTAVSADGDWDQARIFVQSPGGERTLVWEGGADARYLETGHLVYAQGDALFAVPFDIDRREVTPPSTPIVEDVLRSTTGVTSTGQYAVSDNGTFVQISPLGATPNAATILVYADLNGGIEEIALPTGTYGHARVSPDGTRIVFDVTEADGRTDLWVYDRDGQSQPVQLTRGGNNSRPIWSPDSEYVTFMSTRDGTPSIWWQRADLSDEAEKLTASDGAFHWPDAWSPDGETLLYTRFASVEDQTVQALTMGTDAEPVQLSEPGQLAGGAAFSPSGERIAYRSTLDLEDFLTAQIFVRAFPPSGPEVQVSLNGGSFPIFSSDGQRLFYRRPATDPGAEAQNEIVGIDISQGRVGIEQVLPIEGVTGRFGIRDYDVVSGEDRFLLMRPASFADAAGAPRQEIRIILNWFDELRERAPIP